MIVPASTESARGKTNAVMEEARSEFFDFIGRELGSYLFLRKIYPGVTEYFQKRSARGLQR